MRPEDLFSLRGLEGPLCEVLLPPGSAGLMSAHRPYVERYISPRMRPSDHTFERHFEDHIAGIALVDVIRCFRVKTDQPSFIDSGFFPDGERDYGSNPLDLLRNEREGSASGRGVELHG